MIKKRNTYSFEKIIAGIYRIERKELHTIFSKTTISEKLEILEGDFDKNWKKVYGNLPEEKNKYYKKYLEAREKYTKLLNYEEGKFIRQILERAKSVSTLWDFTKGRKSHDKELGLDTAIREFYEETCIDLRNIMFIPQYHKTHTVLANSIIYRSQLFLAIQKNTEETSSDIPQIYIRNRSQIMEIVDLKWLTLAELTELDVLHRLSPTVKKFMKEVKENYNNGKVDRS